MNSRDEQTIKPRIVSYRTCVAGWAISFALASWVPVTARASHQAAARPEPAAHEEVAAAYQRGMQLLHEGRYTDALEQFRSIERDAPRSPYGPSGEGIALVLMAKPQEAVAALKRALELEPSFWVAQRELGIVYWSQNLKDEAARELEPVIK